MISSAILQTLKYSDHFGFPLTLNEIYSRLINSKPCSLRRVLKTLQLMVQKSQVQKTGNFYHLHGHHALVARRLARAKSSIPQLTRAKLFASRLSLFPSVLAIYLTGSLAMSNSSKDSDIDLMIITQNNRLWTTRFFLTIYTELLGLRRRPHTKHTSGKICLNLYLTPMSYELPIHKRSLYTAYELIQAVPLYDPNDTHSDLLLANSWIKNYLPNFPLPIHAGPGLAGPSNLPARPGPIGNMIEKCAYHLQLSYMRRRLTREYITPDAAFFHPHDPGQKIIQLLDA